MKKKSKYGGQAMVEFIVLAGAIVALFLGIWYLGKLHDIQAVAIQAVRYAAWERTVHPVNYSDTQIEEQLRARLFEWNSHAVTSSDGVTQSADWQNLNSLWRDHKDQAWLIAKPSDIVVRTTNNVLPSNAGVTITHVLDGVSAVVGKITGGERLNTSGFYQSQVYIKLAELEEFSGIQLNLQESYALVTDNWEANSPRQVVLRTRSFTPAAIFTTIQPLLDPVKWALSLIEPSINYFDPGKICPDIVPGDRLGNSARNLPMYQSNVECY